jgi:glucose/arabinose dehydrogenase
MTQSSRMLRQTLLRVAAATLIAACAVPSRGAAQATWPPGFVDEPYVNATFTNPTAMAMLPGGRLLVAEKAGNLWVVSDTVKTLMWSHTREINTYGDRGLIGLTVDPNYAQNHYVYLLYVVSPDSSGGAAYTLSTFGRLTRYTVSATDSNALDESSRKVLIGATWTTGFPQASETHTVDDLEWGADGTLLVSCGESSHPNFTDAGNSDAAEFGPGRIDLEQNVGAFRALDLGSLSGKIIRIDPATGLGLSSNPYWTGDASANRSRVWLYGFRNPFRFSVKPGTGAADPALGQPGTLYIGDVGWNTFEEIDVAPAGGIDYGWPCFEGFIGNNSYQLSTPVAHGCDTFGTPDNPMWPTRPIIEINHSDGSESTPQGPTGATLIGGAFYEGARYPQAFLNGYFFGDYSYDWIKVAYTDPSDHLLSVADFGSGTNGPVDFLRDPATGDIVYLAIYTGQVRRIRYAASVGVGPGVIPELSLSSPWPNPSTGAVSLALELPAPARIEWSIVDAAGRTVWRAPEREAPAGHVPLLWGGVSAAGFSARPGIYLARVSVDGRTTSRRFALIR